MHLRWQYIIPVTIVCFIFFPVFTTDYAYLDEAHQLWHRADSSNFGMFAEQGRFITGIIIQKLFGSIDHISALKMLRMLSFFGWAIACVAWIYVLNKWNAYLQLPKMVLLFSSIFLMCSPPVAIYIGWASCVEIWIGFIAALLSGHILFMELMKQGDHIQLPTGKLVVIVLLGLVSLFIYQTCFGAFLIPFILYFIFVAKGLRKKWIIGCAVYLMISLLYYPLFKYSLKYFAVAASDRTSISYDVMAKLSFFFSKVLAPLFSFNVLYNYHGIFSQAFYPFCALVLLLLIYKTSNGIKQSLSSVLLFLTLIVLMYLPVMVARENFASYRTLVCALLVMSTVLFSLLYRVLAAWRYKDHAAIAMMVLIVAIAYYNYNYQFRKPLKAEFAKLNNGLKNIDFKAVDTILFKRPTENAFYANYGVRVYNDEFGLPSTYKDWTPDPLIRQMIWERYADRRLAESVVVVQGIANDSISVADLSKRIARIDMDSVIAAK